MALDAYQQAQKANRLDDEIQARMGLTFDLMHRYPEAFFCYQTATRAQPHNGQFWNALGNHYWQRGMLQKAEQSYIMAARCPFGKEGGWDAAGQLRQQLDAQGVQPPAQGTNPLDSSSDEVEPGHRATTP